MYVEDGELDMRFSTALEAAGDVAYSWDLDGDRLDWSGRLAAAEFDFASELTTGRSFANRIHPEDLVQRQLALAEHFDDEAAFDCAYRLRDAAGGFFWWRDGGRATRGRRGRSLCMPRVIRGARDSTGRAVRPAR